MSWKEIAVMVFCFFLSVTCNCTYICPILLPPPSYDEGFSTSGPWLVIPSHPIPSLLPNNKTAVPAASSLGTRDVLSSSLSSRRRVGGSSPTCQFGRSPGGSCIRRGMYPCSCSPMFPRSCVAAESINKTLTRNCKPIVAHF